MSATRCAIQACNAALDTVIDRLGRVRAECPACRRRKLALCLDCPARVPRRGHGQAWRCGRCRKRHLARMKREKMRVGSERLRTLTARQLARKDRGVCVECPTRVAGRAWRCAGCKGRQAARSHRRYRQRLGQAYAHRTWARIQQAEAAHPEQRQHRLAMKRRWRQANPRKVAIEKRRERLKGKTPAQIAHRRAYNRAWRARRAQQMPPQTERAA